MLFDFSEDASMGITVGSGRAAVVVFGGGGEESDPTPPTPSDDSDWTGRNRRLRGWQHRVWYR